MSRPPLRKMKVESAEPFQMNIYQSNTYRKDLSWLYFDKGSREAASEGPTVLHICFCSLCNNSK